MTMFNKTKDSLYLITDSQVKNKYPLFCYRKCIIIRREVELDALMIKEGFCLAICLFAYDYCFQAATRVKLSQ